jgi:hypothetical protein
MLFDCACRASSSRGLPAQARRTWHVPLLARLASLSSVQWAASLWRCLQVSFLVSLHKVVLVCVVDKGPMLASPVSAQWAASL